MFELSIRSIDLGLSVCWGSANVGTYGYDTKLGPMFAWGECQTKESFTQGSYTLYPHVPSNYWKPLKYKTADPTKGPVVLASEDDAATQIEGNNWRMPTIEECKELFEKCSWHFTEYAKTKGWVVKGPKYGSIFIPVTDDGQVLLWSSSLSEENWFFAQLFRVSEYHGRADGFFVDKARWLGHYIRPVAINAMRDTEYLSVKRNNVRAVDLGLSVLWSSCDCVSAPWGELSEPVIRNWDTYKYCRTDGGHWERQFIDEELVETGRYIQSNKIYITKYKEAGAILEKEDDAASFWWGEDWRTPTSAEWNELISKCDWKFDANRRQWVITGKTGESIILKSDYNAELEYWASTKRGDDPTMADALVYRNGEGTKHEALRCKSLRIRGVCSKK